MGDRSYLLDLFAQYGPIRLRRMFGADGIFTGEVMIGFADDDIIYLKTDETTRPAFAAEGCKPFIYKKRSGEAIAMSYWRIPDRLYDDPEELAEWARRAQAVAEKSPTAERKRKRHQRLSSPASAAQRREGRGPRS